MEHAGLDVDAVNDAALADPLRESPGEVARAGADVGDTIAFLESYCVNDFNRLLPSVPSRILELLNPPLRIFEGVLGALVVLQQKNEKER